MPSGKRRFFWNCKCECGNIKSISGVSLANGDTISCGCFGAAQRLKASTTHGLTNSRAYNSWRGMIERCTNPNHRQYKDYGGRGIVVCVRWQAFNNFFEDMGHPEKGLSLERKNGSKPYEPSNCIWANRTTQSRNKRNNRVIEYNGESFCMAEWAERLGLSYNALQSRLDRGWPIEKALTYKLR